MATLHNETQKDEKETGIQHDSDFQRLSGIFPMEVWRIILRAQTNPQTLRNLGNASLVFREELLSLRTTYLLPAVWDILGTTNKNFQRQVQRNGTQDIDCSSCGRKRIRRPFSWILNLRRVCKPWSSAVDEFYEKDNIQDGYNWTRWSVSSEIVGPFLNHFAKSQHLEKCRNPFVGRSISLSIDTNYRDWLQMYEMLKLYGQHVHDCTLHNEDAFLNNVFYERFKEALDLMPQLKRLGINFCIEEHRMHQIQIFVNEAPLKTFACLEHLEINEGCGPILEEILSKSSKTLKGVEIEYYDADGCIPTCETMKKLDLEYFTSHVSLDLFWFLEDVPFCNSLKILDLTFNYDCVMSVRRIFSMLETRWQGTLSNVSLSIGRKENYDNEIQLMCDSKTLQLNLPKVTKFKLYVEFFMTFDFLEPMHACLENLEVGILFKATKEGKIKVANIVADLQRVQIVDHQHKMLESNIWKTFTKLQYVEIDVRTIPDSKFKHRVPEWMKSSGTMKTYFRPD